MPEHRKPSRDEPAQDGAPSPLDEQLKDSHECLKDVLDDRVNEGDCQGPCHRFSPRYVQLRPYRARCEVEYDHLQRRAWIVNGRGEGAHLRLTWHCAAASCSWYVSSLITYNAPGSTRSFPMSLLDLSQQPIPEAPAGSSSAWNPLQNAMLAHDIQPKIDRWCNSLESLLYIVGAPIISRFLSAKPNHLAWIVFLGIFQFSGSVNGFSEAK